MKKIFSALLVLIAFSVMGGVASAGNLYLTADQSATAAAFSTTSDQPYEYPAEAITRSNIGITFSDGTLTSTQWVPECVVTQGGAFAKSIIFKTTTNLPSGTRIDITLTNGTWGNTQLFLIKQQDPNGLDTDVSDFDGASSASTDGFSANKRTAHFIVGVSFVPANTLMIISSSQDFTANNAMNATNPLIYMDSILGTVGTKVNVAADFCADTFGPIAGCTASAIPIIGSYDQWVWSRSPGLGEIDVTNPSYRTKFIDGGDADTDPDLVPGLPGSLTLKDHGRDGSDVDGLSGAQVASFRIDYQCGFDIDYEITGAQLYKLDSLCLDDDPAGDYCHGFDIVSDTTATLREDTWDSWLSDGSTDNVIFTVQGDNILNPQIFNVTAALRFYDSDLQDQVLTSAKIMEWQINNGWQVTVPYFWAETAQISDTFIKIFNNSDAIEPGAMDAEIFAEVYPDAGGGPISIKVGEVGAGKVGLFWGKDIATAAGLTLPAPFAAVFTATVPKDRATAMANQKRPGLVDRVVPVYSGEADQYKHY